MKRIGEPKLSSTQKHTSLQATIVLTRLIIFEGSPQDCCTSSEPGPFETRSFKISVNVDEGLILWTKPRTVLIVPNASSICGIALRALNDPMIFRRKLIRAILVLSVGFLGDTILQISMKSFPGKDVPRLCVVLCIDLIPKVPGRNTLPERVILYHF